MTRFIVYYNEQTVKAFATIVETLGVKVVGKGKVLSYFVVETENMDAIEAMQNSGLVVEEIKKIGLIKPVELE